MSGRRSPMCARRPCVPGRAEDGRQQPVAQNGELMEHETEPEEARGPAWESGSAQERQGSPEPEAEAEAAGRPGTGEPRVDAALRLLDRLPGLPVSDHPELFEQVHAQLTEVLGELDYGPASPAGQHGS
jgi:hypothetical protein